MCRSLSLRPQLVRYNTRLSDCSSYRAAAAIQKNADERGRCRKCLLLVAVAPTTAVSVELTQVIDAGTTAFVGLFVSSIDV
jgi:hypothetical protein